MVFVANKHSRYARFGCWVYQRSSEGSWGNIHSILVFIPLFKIANHNNMLRGKMSLLGVDLLLNQEYYSKVALFSKN